jgi:hypothetical protein
MLIALVTLLSRACARVVMSDSEDSLNDWTADDEPAKKKPKNLFGYFDTFDPNDPVQVAAKIERERNPGQDTLLTSFVSGSSYHCMSGQVADHFFGLRRPSDEKVGHSAFISTRFVIPVARRQEARRYQLKWTGH